MPEFEVAETVHVENEWYDGPRVGVANIGGRPHRFKSLFDEEADEYMGTFLVWEVDAEELALEVEQWQIFVKWNDLYESGKAGTETHPGNRGLSARWDEIEDRLVQARSAAPSSAKRAIARIEHIERQKRYEATGPDYRLAWRLL